MKVANKHSKNKGQKNGNKTEKIRDTNIISLESAVTNQKEKTGEDDMKDMVQEKIKAEERSLS